MPNEHKWPLQKDMMNFYGNFQREGWQEENLVRVEAPFQLYYGQKKIPSITIHRKCAQSLKTVLNAVWQTDLACSNTLAQVYHCHAFSGSFNIRKMRGSSKWSMHSWGAAIDFDAGNNMLGDYTPFFHEDHPLVKAFEAEGWTWGGRWAYPDAMHFQAARVK